MEAGQAERHSLARLYLKSLCLETLWEAGAGMPAGVDQLLSIQCDQRDRRRHTLIQLKGDFVGQPRADLDWRKGKAALMCMFLACRMQSQFGWQAHKVTSYMRPDLCCADIAALQQTYVRYGSSDAATASSQGWQKPLSQRANLADASGPDVLARVPDSIVMEIIRAPAEFAVPVKQDRCACPELRMPAPWQLPCSTVPMCAVWK